MQFTILTDPVTYTLAHWNIIYIKQEGSSDVSTREGTQSAQWRHPKNAMSLADAIKGTDAQLRLHLRFRRRLQQIIQPETRCP